MQSEPSNDRAHWEKEDSRLTFAAMGNKPGREYSGGEEEDESDEASSSSLPAPQPIPAAGRDVGRASRASRNRTNLTVISSFVLVDRAW